MRRSSFYEELLLWIFIVTMGMPETEQNINVTITVKDKEEISG